MTFWGELFGVSADPATPSGTDDPEIAAMAASLGIDLNALASMSTATSSSSSVDLASAALDSAISMSPTYQNPMPWWAQSVADSVIAQGQFDKVYNQVGDGVVYLGTNPATATTVPASGPANKMASEMDGRPDTATTETTKPKDFAVTVTDAESLPYGWDQQEVVDAIKRMKDAGLNVTDFDSLVSTWQGLVGRAAATYMQTDGQRKLTPWDVLDLYKSESVAAGAYVDPNRTETYTQRNVTEITEGQAWSAIQSTLSQMLGRDPSDQELRDFSYRMNRMAATNPSISKTITQYKDGSAVSSSTHTDPGLTADDIAQTAYDTAQDDPEYAEYRGASYLFNAAQSALGPIGG